MLWFEFDLHRWIDCKNCIGFVFGFIIISIFVFSFVRARFRLMWLWFRFLVCVANMFKYVMLSLHCQYVHFWIHFIMSTFMLLCYFSLWCVTFHYVNFYVVVLPFVTLAFVLLCYFLLCCITFHYVIFRVVVLLSNSRINFCGVTIHNLALELATSHKNSQLWVRICNLA